MVTLLRERRSTDPGLTAPSPPSPTITPKLSPSSSQQQQEQQHKRRGAKRIWIKRGNRLIMKRTKSDEKKKGEQGSSTGGVNSRPQALNQHKKNKHQGGPASGSTSVSSQHIVAAALQKISEATAESSSCSSAEPEQERKTRQSRSPRGRRTTPTGRLPASSHDSSSRDKTSSSVGEDTTTGNRASPVGTKRVKTRQGRRNRTPPAHPRIPRPPLTPDSVGSYTIALNDEINHSSGVSNESSSEIAEGWNNSLSSSRRTAGNPRSSVTSMPSLDSHSTFETDLDFESMSGASKSRRSSSMKGGASIPSLASFSSMGSSTREHASTRNSGSTSAVEDEPGSPQRTSSLTSLSVELDGIQPTSELTLLINGASSHSVSVLSDPQGSSSTTMQGSSSTHLQASLAHLQGSSSTHTPLKSSSSSSAKRGKKPKSSLRGDNTSPVPVQPWHGQSNPSPRQPLHEEVLSPSIVIPHFPSVEASLSSSSSQNYDTLPKPAQRTPSPMGESKPAVRLNQQLTPVQSWRSDTSLVGQHLLQTPDLDKDSDHNAKRSPSMARKVPPRGITSQKSSESMAYSEDSEPSAGEAPPALNMPMIQEESSSSLLDSATATTKSTTSPKDVPAKEKRTVPLAAALEASRQSPRARRGTASLSSNQSGGTTSSSRRSKSNQSGVTTSSSRRSKSSEPRRSKRIVYGPYDGVMMDMVGNMHGESEISISDREAVLGASLSSLQMSRLGSIGTSTVGASLTSHLRKSSIGGSARNHHHGLPSGSGHTTGTRTSRASVDRSKTRFANLLRSDDFFSSVSTLSWTDSVTVNSWAVRSARSMRRSLHDHLGSSTVRSKSEQRRSSNSLTSRGSAGSGSRRSSDQSSRQSHRQSLESFISASRSISKRQTSISSGGTGTGRSRSSGSKASSARRSSDKFNEPTPRHTNVTKKNSKLKAMENELSESLHTANSPSITSKSGLTNEDLDSTRFSAPARLNRIRSPRRRVFVLANHLQKERSEKSLGAESKSTRSRSQRSTSRSRRSTTSRSSRPSTPSSLPSLRTLKRRAQKIKKKPNEIDERAKTVRHGNRTLDKNPQVAKSVSREHQRRAWSSSPVSRRYRVVGLPPFVEDNEHSSVSSGSTSELSERDYWQTQRSLVGDLSSADTLGQRSWKPDESESSLLTLDAAIASPLPPRHRGLVPRLTRLQTIESGSPSPSDEETLSEALNDERSHEPHTQDGGPTASSQDQLPVSPSPRHSVSGHSMSEHSSIGPLVRIDEGFRHPASPKPKRLTPKSIPIRRKPTPMIRTNADGSTHSTMSDVTQQDLEGSRSQFKTAVVAKIPATELTSAPEETSTLPIEAKEAVSPRKEKPRFYTKDSGHTPKKTKKLSPKRNKRHGTGAFLAGEVLPAPPPPPFHDSVDSLSFSLSTQDRPYPTRAGLRPDSPVSFEDANFGSDRKMHLNFNQSSSSGNSFDISPGSNVSPGSKSLWVALLGEKERQQKLRHRLDQARAATTT